MEESLNEDWSEDGDDEDSQGDDNVLPQIQAVCNNDFISPSSTEERRDAVDQEFVKVKIKIYSVC